MQDLGTFSVSSDPSDGDFREGDAQQKRPPVDESPLDPLPSELDAMNFVERMLYHIGDFWAQNFRYARKICAFVCVCLSAFLCVGVRDTRRVCPMISGTTVMHVRFVCLCLSDWVYVCLCVIFASQLRFMVTGSPLCASNFACLCLPVCVGVCIRHA
jgi:hypothetical protein